MLRQSITLRQVLWDAGCCGIIYGRCGMLWMLSVVVSIICVWCGCYYGLGWILGDAARCIVVSFVDAVG